MHESDGRQRDLQHRIDRDDRWGYGDHHVLERQPDQDQRPKSESVAIDLHHPPTDYSSESR